MKSQITQTWLEILTLYSNSLSLRSEFQWSYPALPRTLPSTHFQVPSVFTAPIQTLFLIPETNFCHEHVNKQSGPNLICCHAGKDVHVVLSWWELYTTVLLWSFKYLSQTLKYLSFLFPLCAFSWLSVFVSHLFLLTVNDHQIPPLIHAVLSAVTPGFQAGWNVVKTGTKTSQTMRNPCNGNTNNKGIFICVLLKMRHIRPGPVKSRSSERIFSPPFKAVKCDQYFAQCSIFFSSATMTCTYTLPTAFQNALYRNTS